MGRGAGARGAANGGGAYGCVRWAKDKYGLERDRKDRRLRHVQLVVPVAMKRNGAQLAVMEMDVRAVGRLVRRNGNLRIGKAGDGDGGQ